MLRRLLCLSALLIAMSTSATTVTVAVNHSPPYRILSNEQVGGFYVDVFNALAQELGWDVHYVQVPFRRVLWMLKQGQADVMLGALPTPERREYMDFSVPAFPAEPKRFFLRPEDRPVVEYDDLYGRVIGVLRGSAYAERFDSDPGLIREPQVSYDILMRMLSAGRLDLVVAPERLGRHVASQVPGTIEVARFTLMGTESYIAISRQSDIMQHRDQLRAALARLKENGTFERIQKRYHTRE